MNEVSDAGSQGQRRPHRGSRERAHGRFTGWPEQAFDVLVKLEGEPPVAVRESLRKEREELVRQPMIALMQDIAAADASYDDFTVPGFRIMLGPWQRQVGFIRTERHIDHRVWFDLDGLYVQGAVWYVNPGSKISPEREAFLAAVADETSGSEWVAIVETLRSQDYDVTADVAKRFPRGYPADHPRAELLRHRSLVAGRSLGCEGWLHTPEAVERVHAAFEELRPMTSWFADHVPPLPEIP